jgi:hypothetical protein
MLRRAPAVRTAVPAIAIVASVVLWSVEPRGKPQDLLLNPPELHACLSPVTAPINHEDKGMMAKVLFQ